MTKQLQRLAERIREELADLEWVLRRIETGWYGYSILTTTKIQQLIKNAPALFSQVQAELRAFAMFLEQRS